MGSHSWTATGWGCWVKSSHVSRKMPTTRQAARRSEASDDKQACMSLAPALCVEHMILAVGSWHQASIRAPTVGARDVISMRAIQIADRGLFPEDDSDDDEMVFGDDDFPS